MSYLQPNYAASDHGPHIAPKKGGKEEKRGKKRKKREEKKKRLVDMQ